MINDLWYKNAVLYCFPSRHTRMQMETASEISPDLCAGSTICMD
jgi:hypothetical protein